MCACLLLSYYILYELCCICPCSHFQMSASVFRLEVLRCSRPVPPILQTTVDPSSDKASLCVCICVCRPPCLCQRSPRVEICVCVFLLWPIWGKPFVTDLGGCHFGPHSRLLGSAPASRSQMMQVVTNQAKMAVKRREERTEDIVIFPLVWSFVIVCPCVLK